MPLLYDIVSLQENMKQTTKSPIDPSTFQNISMIFHARA
jgi:hypothetical protein